MRFITPTFLIGEDIPYTDEAGDTSYKQDERKVFSHKLSIGQSEFYQAHTTGLKPELKVEMRSCEYRGEEKLRLENRIYNIVRTYDKQDGIIQLICSKEIRNACT